MRRLLPAMACVLLFSGQGVSGEVLPDLSGGQTGQVWFSSVDAAGPNTMISRSYKHNVPIFGYLNLPRDVPGKVPAMIIMHGTGGIVRKDADWAKMFREMGIATFQVDSFKPRGVETGQSDKYPSWYSVGDAYMALKFLATHPAIDRDRIGVIGFSRGGMVSLYSLMEAIRSSFIDDDLKFRLHVPLYPLCNIKLLGQTTGAPILIISGEKDDWTPASVCVEYAGWLKLQQGKAEIMVLPGAHHAFDDPTIKSGEFTSYYIAVARECYIDVDLTLGTPVWSHGKTGKAFGSTKELNEYVASCRKYGSTVGYSSRATQQARQAVKEFVAREMLP